MLLFSSVTTGDIVKNKLEEIYRLYHKHLFYVAYSILKDYHESEDMVQYAILKISDNIEKIDEVKCIKTKRFISTIIRNLSINAYNLRKRRGTVAIEKLENILVDKSTVSPEQYILRIDQVEYIARQLRLLKSEYVYVLILKYTHEYSNNEIAKLLNISKGNVRVKLTRARRALHILIERNKY